MSMNLHELIISPGKSLSFSCEIDTARFDSPSILRFLSPLVGEGEIRNNAGLITLRGHITAEMLCVCDRCAAEFTMHCDLPLELTLATELEDEENPDYYLLIDEKFEPEEVFSDCFLLGLDTSFLCREDCKGLCYRCGANLNEGKCSCTKEKDPRLAVLEQLLDDND